MSHKGSCVKSLVPRLSVLVDDVDLWWVEPTGKLLCHLLFAFKKDSDVSKGTWFIVMREMFSLTQVSPNVCFPAHEVFLPSPCTLSDRVKRMGTPKLCQEGRGDSCAVCHVSSDQHGVFAKLAGNRDLHQLLLKHSLALWVQE